jgi:hypothetical protein
MSKKLLYNYLVYIFSLTVISICIFSLPILSHGFTADTTQILQVVKRSSGHYNDVHEYDKGLYNDAITYKNKRIVVSSPIYIMKNGKYYTSTASEMKKARMNELAKAKFFLGLLKPDIFKKLFDDNRLDIVFSNTERVGGVAYTFSKDLSGKPRRFVLISKPCNYNIVLAHELGHFMFEKFSKDVKERIESERASMQKKSKFNMQGIATEFFTQATTDYVFRANRDVIAFSAYGYSKYMKDLMGNLYGSSIVGPAGYTYCASEGGRFRLPGLSNVAYGINGKFFYKTGVSGTITFNNSTFGGDPVPNVRKYGFYRIKSK